jgi:hypothetical protein
MVSFLEKMLYLGTNLNILIDGIFLADCVHKVDFATLLKFETRYF